MITTGATCLVSELKAKTNTPINPREYFAKAVSNVVTLLAFGERRSYDDPLFNKFMKIVAEVVVQIGGPRALNLYPSLRFIPGIRRLIGYDRLQNNLEYLNSHYRQWIDDHKQKMASGQQPTDLIGSYLVELEKKREEPDSTFSGIHKTRLRESHAVILRDRVVPASQVPFPGEPSGEPGNGTWRAGINSVPKKWQRGILFLTRNYQTIAKN